MRLTIRCFCYIFLSLTISNKFSKSLPTKFAVPNLRVRVKRQNGYVYDKPNISFDLPSPSTTESTQATTVDRTLTQHTIFGYPAPASGAAFNANSVSTTSGTTAIASQSAGAVVGYSYRSSANDNASSGYNYQDFAVQGNAGTSVSNTDSQASVTDPQSNSGPTQVISGYNINVPSPGLVPSLQGPLEVSTSAPKYLPPALNGGNGMSRDDGSTNIDSGSSSRAVPGSLRIPSVNYLPPLNNNAISTPATGDGGTRSTNVGNVSQTITGSLDIPADNYLPPSSNNAISIEQTTSISTGSQANLSGPVSVPSTAYLPPIPSPPVPVPSTQRVLSSMSEPPTPIGSYIPQSNTGLNSGSVSTPATKYLPPGFF